MRIVLETYEASFARVRQRSLALLERTSDEQLYRQPFDRNEAYAALTIGECILRSAAAVEQTFGGLTTRLWDDPFEWTLPEKLSSVESVKEYLDEVERAALDGFQTLKTDDDLSMRLPAPVEVITIAQLLTETLARASHHQGRAYALYQIVAGAKPPRI